MSVTNSAISYTDQMPDAIRAGVQAYARALLDFLYLEGTWYARSPTSRFRENR
jgi:hypothetical protein